MIKMAMSIATGLSHLHMDIIGTQVNRTIYLFRPYKPTMLESFSEAHINFWRFLLEVKK